MTPPPSASSTAERPARRPLPASLSEAQRRALDQFLDGQISAGELSGRLEQAKAERTGAPLAPAPEPELPRFAAAKGSARPHLRLAVWAPIGLLAILLIGGGAWTGALGLTGSVRHDARHSTRVKTSAVPVHPRARTRPIHRTQTTTPPAAANPLETSTPAPPAGNRKPSAHHQNPPGQHRSPSDHPGKNKASGSSRAPHAATHSKPASNPHASQPASGPTGGAPTTPGSGAGSSSSPTNSSGSGNSQSGTSGSGSSSPGGPPAPDGASGSSSLSA